MSSLNRCLASSRSLSLSSPAIAKKESGECVSIHSANHILSSVANKTARLADKKIIYGA